MSSHVGLAAAQDPTAQPGPREGTNVSQEACLQCETEIHSSQRSFVQKQPTGETMSATTSERP